MSLDTDVVRALANSSVSADFNELVYAVHDLCDALDAARAEYREERAAHEECEVARFDAETRITAALALCGTEWITEDIRNVLTETPK